MDWWTGEKSGISAQGFYNDLKAAEAKYNDITIRINSVGGSMVDGNAIYALIKASAKNISIICEANAYSMAAVLMQAAKKGNRKMVRNGLVMIHEAKSMPPWYMSATEARQFADELDKFNQTAIAEYAMATGKTEDEVRQLWFDGKDHFLTAQECLALGLIDEIVNTDAPSAQMFSSAPRSHADGIRMVLNQNQPNMLQKITAHIREAFLNEFSLEQKKQPMNLDSVVSFLEGDEPITIEKRTDITSALAAYKAAKFTQEDLDAAKAAADKSIADAKLAHDNAIKAQADIVAAKDAEIAQLKADLAARASEESPAAGGGENGGKPTKYAWTKKKYSN